MITGIKGMNYYIQIYVCLYAYMHIYVYVYFVLHLERKHINVSVMFLHGVSLYV